jgi:asparagine synthase (glutamine-hydrolysing)
MCGIAGIVAALLSPQHREALQHMMDAIAHRGPDGEGHQLYATCALGHRRLAIVDLSGGAQPMSSTDGQVAVTFNGEIYGYKDLRRSLHDYSFRTQSDTEVILALYARYGSDAVKHLPGMFAFAVWDDRKRELFCARDRFGEKPLYYATGRGGELLFASEIKAILASGLIEPILDKGAVARYLRRQCVRVDQSIYSNIRALPPGHTLSFRNGRIELKRYWELPDVDSDIGVGGAVERFRSLLGDAVKRQLIADVPVGAFLSGGLDSSTICLLANEVVGDLRTFSFDFEGDHSEVAYARAAAEAFRTRHVELAAQGEDIAGQLLRMQHVFDEPMGDTSAIPTYLLAREARRHVKVALTGDGGDELCGGYLWYKPLLWMEREGRVSLLQWVAARVLNHFYRFARIPGAAARELRIMGLAFGQQHESVLAAHRAQLLFFDRGMLERLGILDEAAAESPEESRTPGSMDDVLRFDVCDYMAANNLTRIDRASMAHGLELRAPFLDVDFASFCLSLPYRLKVSTDEDKIILRQAFAAQWPAIIRKRAKQGFGAPLKRWFRSPAIKELEERYLLERTAPIYDVVSFSAVRGMLERMSPAQRWTLLVLAVWLAKRVDASNPRRLPGDSSPMRAPTAQTVS